jgi:hypothetical protein
VLLRVVATLPFAGRAADVDKPADFSLSERTLAARRAAWVPLVSNVA